MASAAPPFIHSCTRSHPAPHNFFCRSVKISPSLCRCELNPQSLSPPTGNKRGSYAGHLKQRRDVSSLTSEPTEEAFCRMIRRYSKARKVEQALGVLDEMEVKRFAPTTKIYNMLLNFVMYESEFRMVESLYSRMKSAGIQPNIETFHILIKARCRAGNMHSAWTLLKQMSSDFGVAPNEVTYNTLMAGFVSADRTKSALELLKDMESNGCIPSMKNYTRLIHGLCNKGKMDEAVKIVKDISGNGLQPNIVAYNRVIFGLCKKGKMAEAVELLEMLLRRGHCPDTVTFTTVINGFCNQGRVEDAFKLLEEMREHGLSPDTVTYTIIVRGLCKANEIDKAINLLETMEREGIKPNVFTYNTVILGLCIVGKFEEARKLLDEMAVKGCAPDIFTYNIAFRAMHSEGRTDAAIDLFNDFTSKGHIPNAYTYRTIFFLCKDGDLSAALNLIYCMLDRDYIPNNKSFKVLVKRLERMGMSDQAKQLIEEMEAKSSSPGSVSSAIIGRVEDHHILKSDSQETSDSSGISGVV